MDRLSPVGTRPKQAPRGLVSVFGLVVLVALPACNDKQPTPAATSRFEAVKAQGDSTSRWCDVSYAGDAPRMTLPPLAAQTAGRPSLALPKGKRAWVNLWATWCKPCLRELPLLLQWQSELRKDGVEVEPILLSLDEDGAALDKFLAERKDIPAVKVARATSQQDYEQWAKSYLKDPTTPIPIHFLVSADGNLRCIRSGSLREGDYPAAKAALR